MRLSLYWLQISPEKFVADTLHLYAHGSSVLPAISLYAMLLTFREIFVQLPNNLV